MDTETGTCWRAEKKRLTDSTNIHFFKKNDLETDVICEDPCPNIGNINLKNDTFFQSFSFKCTVTKDKKRNPKQRIKKFNSKTNFFRKFSSIWSKMYV